MTELHAEFDNELWRWALRPPDTSATSGAPTAPAGLASVRLADGAWVHVDAATGRLVELTIDAVTSAGRLDEAGDAALAALDPRVASPAEGITTSVRVDSILGRLALLCEWRSSRASLGPVSPWWDVEAAALFRALDIDAPQDGPGAAPPAPPQLELTGDVDGSAWRTRIDTVVAGSGVVTDRSVLAVSSGELGRLADPSEQRLGLLPDTGSGRVAVDPSLIPPDRLDLRTGVNVTVDRARSSLVVSARVRQGIYAADVQSIVAVLVDEVDDVPIAVGALGLGLGADRDSVEAGTDLVVGGERDLATVSLQMTSTGVTLPSGRLRRERRALAAARAVLTAQRLAQSPGGELWDGGAFLGELADAATLDVG